MKILYKFLTGLMMLFMGFVMIPLQIYAENVEMEMTDEISENETSENLSTNTMQGSDILNGADIEIDESVTTESFFLKLAQKGYEIADGYRAVCIPITVITFVTSVLTAIFGVLSKRATVMPGLIGAIISIIAFTLIYTAPSIILWGSRFLTS